MSYPLILIDSEEAIRGAANDLGMLNTLVDERRNFYKTYETRVQRQELRSWLIKGSLILNEFGGIYLFTPSERFKHFDFPDVVETKKIDVAGCTQGGGNKHSLPKKGSICPYCGREVTLEDVYSHNFCVENPNNSFAFHEGICSEFHSTFNFSFAVARELILAAKRAFGEIEKVCVKEGNSKQDPSVTISFIAVNHKIKILVKQYNAQITITYRKDDTKGVIFNSFFFRVSDVEKKLKEWKDKL